MARTWGLGRRRSLRRSPWSTPVLLSLWLAASLAGVASADPLVTMPAWQVVSGQSHALMGASVGGAGDVNGDGYDDVVVGALEATNRRTLGRGPRSSSGEAA